MARGTLNVGHTALTSKTFGETWNLDETGNWSAYTRDDDGNLTNDLVQARTANEVNDIGTIINSVGTSWAQPAYSPAGNMTTIPQPKDPSKEYLATYDAWNRLVKLEEEVSNTLETVSTYTYDGRKFQIVVQNYTAGVVNETHHLYYNSGWQNLEDRLSTSPETEDPHQHHIWGTRYIDNCLLRDRTTDSTLDERLYALQDANWNVDAIIDNAGDVQERFAYSPYGVPSFLGDQFLSLSTTIGWEVLYCGYHYECTTELPHVRHRIFNITLGTWIQRDPLIYPDGPNTYAAWFAPNDTDPLGLGITSIDTSIEECIKKPTYALQKECLELLADTLSKGGQTKGKLLVEIATSSLIHSHYKAMNCKECHRLDPCKPKDRAEAAIQAACWTAKAAERQLYLTKRCDYILPGSKNEGSVQKEKGHRIRQLLDSLEAGFCANKTLPPVKNKKGNN